MTPRNPLRREEFRFELRPYEISHVDEVYASAIESRREIGPWMAWLHADYQRLDVEKWTAHCINAWSAQSEYEFVIHDRKEDVPIGSCGLNNIDRKDMVSNLGYWVRTSKTGLGAATQATLLIKDFGLNVLGFNRLEIIVADGNAASRRVAEKAGAVYEGVQRRRIKVADKVYDAHMYAFV
jgi:RimJ/RimL family protein N-acetyltransferase